MKAQKFFRLVLILALLAAVSGAVGAATPLSAYKVTGSESALYDPVQAGSPGEASLLPDSFSLSGSLCPPLPTPTGDIVHVSTVAGLQDAVNNLTSGDTILLADGTYNLNGAYLWIDVPDVTIRSVSKNREAVIIDGNYQTTEMVTVAASNVTIADLTLQRASTHPIHVVSTDNGDTNNTLIYNVHIIDPGEQAIKINPHEAKTYFPDNGVVACSHIELTDEGRTHVRNDCYTGGVDGHQAQGWVIRDNVIEGFWCEHGLSEHGIHFWTGSRDTVVERNVLINNARGVGFGLGENDGGRVYDDNPCPSADYVGHFDGIIRNNFIFANRDVLFASDYGFDCGICLAQACGTQVLHNTVVSTDAPFSSIEWRFSNTDAEITNNLVSHNLMQRNGAIASLEGNLEDAPLSLFVDGAGGDLHLSASASSAIDQGISIAQGLCDDDIDGDARPIGSAPDVGADEYGVPAPAAVADLRVTHAITASGTLTTTLRWTAPADAVTTTLRYSDTLITEANWAGALLLTDTLPGSAEIYTATVPYSDSTVYFALKSQNAEGDGSDLSNNAFWPHWDVFLPLVTKGG
jgi:hypothetical protein